MGHFQQTEINQLHDVIKVCKKTAGASLSDLNDLYKFRSIKKAKTIAADPSHCGLGADTLLRPLPMLSCCLVFDVVLYTPGFNKPTLNLDQ